MIDSVRGSERRKRQRDGNKRGVWEREIVTYVARKFDKRKKIIKKNKTNIVTVIL